VNEPNVTGEVKGSWTWTHFYRAMHHAHCTHYSAKRGIETACRLSVSLSVCNVGGSGSHKL